MTAIERHNLAMNTMNAICELLPHNQAKIWSDGEQILCENAYISETVADFIDAMYGDKVCVTGYYDPSEDYKNSMVDNRTGYYYVDIE